MQWLPFIAMGSISFSNFSYFCVDLSSTIDEVRGDLADIKLNIPEDYVTMDNVVPMTRAAENIEILKTFTSDQVS